MKRRFATLPIRRKLMVLVLAASAAALVAALIGFTVFDAFRFRASAAGDTLAVAQIIADNSAAALVFNDSEGARQTLDSVRGRPMMALACLYRADGTLLAAYERVAARCPAQPLTRQTWRAIEIHTPVLRNGRIVGTVYAERTLEDLGPRIYVTLGAGGLTLLVALGLALLLAQRLQRTISRPIVELASAARSIGLGQDVEDSPHRGVAGRNGRARPRVRRHGAAAAALERSAARGGG